MTVRITEGGLDDPRVVELVRHHVTSARAVTPPGSSHAFDLSGLKARNVTFWTLWDDDTLVGMGALKHLDAHHGEVKSMHTVKERRRSGAARAMLAHIIETARARGMRRLSLETGSFEFFRPARELYRSHGFVECAPFGDYKADPNSTFMTLELATV